ncbi:hypothetical protein J8J04_01495 ['Fragaria x ananassa' phyllody phytoplasma]|uniref:Uncharacterized protein n=1 Tax='Fragaria x ananassa' phyllody phytoplasma TaxID=2358428 RepID=A0ABS5K386_9MOLU|nr:hypothetical protein ['Fragaria x ananassa' phyllody phytoplasma]MBS2126368.1 hypothetical protein ['Fragaria x ananassa' phyllody phytoplasma]
MNWLFFKQNEKKQLKLLTNFHHSLQGEPFLIEETTLKGEKIKIEFYYLSQSKYYDNLFQSRQFAIWTADKEVYRLLIDQEYYHNFQPLYKKEINVIWLDFIMQIYYKEINLINRIKIIFLTTFLPLSFIIFFIISKITNKTLLFIPFIILLTIIFLINYWIKNQQKNLSSFKDQKFQTTLKEIKQFLGESFFEELLEKQKNYNPSYSQYIQNENDKNNN